MVFQLNSLWIPMGLNSKDWLDHQTFSAPSLCISTHGLGVYYVCNMLATFLFAWANETECLPKIGYTFF